MALTKENFGTRPFALRLNGMKSTGRYYRPFLGLDQRGVQADRALPNAPSLLKSTCAASRLHAIVRSVEPRAA